MLGDEIRRTGQFLYHPALRGNGINLLVVYYVVVVRTNDVRVSAISVVANDDLVSMIPVFSGDDSHRMGLPVYLQSALWLLCTSITSKMGTGTYSE